MPAFTPNLNLYKPGGGSTGLIMPDEVVDVDRLNQNFDAIDVFAGTATTRLDGLRDTRGLVAVKPTGVVGGTADLLGNITLTDGAGALSLNGVFTTAYRRYLIVGYLKAKAACAPSLRLRSAGTDHSGANYNNQISSVGNGSAGGGQENGANLINLAAISATYHDIFIDLGNVMLSGAPKVGQSRVSSFLTGGGTRYSGFFLGNNDSTQFDGFTLTFNGSTADGPGSSLFKVYGYN